MANIDREKTATVKVPHITLKDTIEIRRANVETSELPAIPVISDDVIGQAESVLRELEECPFEFNEELDEVEIRDLLVTQLEKILLFLDKIFELYKDGVPTLPEQMSVYRSTINSNISALRNLDTDIKNIIVNFKRIVLGFVKNLQMQFGQEEDDDFRFSEVITEIERCLVLLKGKL